MTVTELPDGFMLHHWTNPTGDEWVCIASDHGPMCRLCQPVTGALAALLENIMDDRIRVVGMNPDGEFVMKVTAEGERQVRRMIGGRGEETPQ